MSDSRRTDTRSIFTRLLLFTTVLFVSTHASSAFALSNPNQPPTSQSSIQYQTTVGLFDSLPLNEIFELLRSVQASEIVLNSNIEQPSLKSALFDLVQYMANNTDTQTPDEILASVPKYKRMEMFGSWVNEDAPANCYNTRAEVLMRDAVPGARITYAARNPCLVNRGSWLDPYSKNSYVLASAVQIDHVVPLKNAYRSGAHAWSHERRCHYANFLTDPKHLLAVSGHENMVKGDSGPEDYMPPEPTYTCEYLANWMRIKAIWNLHFSPDEQSAIHALLRDNSCDMNLTRIALTDIQNMRTHTLHMNVKCEAGATPESTQESATASAQ